MRLTERSVGRGARLASSVIRRRIDPTPVISRDGLRARVDLRTAHGLRAYRYGLAPPEIPVLRALLRPGDVFVDGGANLGNFSLFAAKLVGPTGRVVAFEPGRAAAGALSENAALNGFSWLRVDRHALGDADGVRPFTEFGGDAIGLSSFSPLLRGGERRQIAVTSLDSALGQELVSFVKLDLEGAEMLALRGAEQVLRRSHPHLLLEVEPERLRQLGATVDDVAGFLDILGYRLYDVAGDRLIELDQLADRHSVNVFASTDTTLDLRQDGVHA